MMSGVDAAYEWSFRDEALAATHRWHIIVLFCLAGSLAGWLVSLLLPSPHRATKELFVGLNVSRAAGNPGSALQASLPIQSANDYKNWQMSSLNSVIYKDSILDETLSRLQLVDPYWQGVSRQDLAEMLHVYWRNAGKWRLVAEHEDPLRAAQAVIAWQDVVVEQVHAAVAQAQNALLLGDEWEAVAQEKARLVSQMSEMDQIRRELLAWQDRLSQRSESQPVAEAERLMLAGLLDRPQQGDAWQAFLATLPGSGSSNGALTGWIEQALLILEGQAQILQARIDEIEQQQALLAQRYTEALDDSLGLSPELLVQKISDRKLEQTVVRSTGIAILVGAGIGLILWCLIWLVAPAIRTKA